MLIANADGLIGGRFTIPAKIPAGAKRVDFLGEATTATATFIGRGVLKTEELRVITSQVNRRTLSWFGDPLAETFILDKTKQIAAVDLWFTAKGGSNVLIQIRDVSLGLPTADVIAEAILPPAQIKLNGFTRFKFPPALLEAGHEYAIVAACNDAVTALAIGELGKFDAVANRWVTSQPYTIGVLLSSSNNRTWTAHQAADLTFRLIAADYSVVSNTVVSGSPQRTVALEPLTLTNADHLIVLAAAERPSADTNVVFDLDLGGALYSVIEGQRLTLPASYSGPLTWSARLIGTYEESPRLYPDIHLVVGTRLMSGDYLSRLIQAEGGTRVAVYYQALTPGSASVKALLDNGGVWVTLPVVSGTPIGDGWVEVACVLTGFAQPETRVKLELTGTAQARPRVRNLRVAIT